MRTNSLGLVVSTGAFTAISTGEINGEEVFGDGDEALASFMGQETYHSTPGDKIILPNPKSPKVSVKISSNLEIRVLKP